MGGRDVDVSVEGIEAFGSMAGEHSPVDIDGTVIC
jgi:hypothetical protein